MNRWTFTSESVTEGHPDKMADQISDAVLDALLDQDPMSRVACETLLTTGLVVVAGEITTKAYVEIPKLVRDVVTDIGYTSSEMGFDGRTCGVTVSIGSQSPGHRPGRRHGPRGPGRHAAGEDILNAQGAGDQGMMFGYACDETDDLMPMPIWLAHRLAQRLAQVRKAGVLPYLRPDGKTQVTFEYEDGRPVRLETVLISTQHKPNVDLETLLLPDLRDHVIAPLVPAEFADDGYQILANPTGKFELGGPHADAGLTGRKIIVDTYGGAARHGGGAFSGKDPSKVDRSAAYAARWVAKHVVASGAAPRCEIQVAYAIGVARPVSLLVETFGTADRRPGPDRHGRRRGVRPAPGGHHPGPRPAPAHLPQDGRLRPLRPHRQGVQLGAAEPARRLQVGAGRCSPEVKKGGRRRAAPATLPEAGRVVVRVLTDVAGVDKEFDYVAAGRAWRPTCARARWSGSTWPAGGSAAGWSVSTSSPAPVWPSGPWPRCGAGGRSRPCVDLAGWAAWRWAAGAASC